MEKTTEQPKEESLHLSLRLKGSLKDNVEKVRDILDINYSNLAKLAIRDYCEKVLKK